MTRAEQGSKNDGKIRRRRALVERYIPLAKSAATEARRNEERRRRWRGRSQ
jgi:hypothetical protein